jgi:hypothetical protein
MGTGGCLSSLQSLSETLTGTRRGQVIRAWENPRSVLKHSQQLSFAHGKERIGLCPQVNDQLLSSGRTAPDHQSTELLGVYMSLIFASMMLLIPSHMTTIFHAKMTLYIPSEG